MDVLLASPDVPSPEKVDPVVSTRGALRTRFMAHFYELQNHTSKQSTAWSGENGERHIAVPSVCIGD